MKKAMKAMIRRIMPPVRKSITDMMLHHVAFAMSDIGLDSDGISHVNNA